MAVIHLVTFHSVLLENCQVSKLFFFQAHKNKAKTSVRCGRSHLKNEPPKKKNYQLVQLHVMSQPNVAYQKSYLKQPVNQPRSPPKENNLR